MALAKKGTRTINVEGSTFRWTVAPNDEPGIAIVVELQESSAQRMATWVEHGNIISPSLVRHVILHALNDGWQPHQKGPEVVFRLFTTSETKQNNQEGPLGAWEIRKVRPVPTYDTI